MKHAYFGIPLVPNVPFQDAPQGVRPLVLGSQLGALVGGGMGLEKTIKDAQDEDMPLPKAVAKGALNVAGGATVGTLTGLGGGVLLNRARGINNTKALEYANKFTFGEPTPPQKTLLERLHTPEVAAGVLAGELGFGGYELNQLHDLHDKVGAIQTSMGFSYMNKTANFANLIPIGAGIGAVKGMLDQPGGEMLDPETGAITERSYNPMERVMNIGMNAGLGAAIGYGGNRLGLNNPRTVGKYMGKASNYAEDRLAKIKPYLPEVEIRTRGADTPLPQEIQSTLDAARKRGLN